MEPINQKIRELAVTYGPDVARAAAQELVGALEKKIPTTYSNVLRVDRLEDTIAGLDAGIADALSAGAVVEDSYKEKATLSKRKWQLETEIKLAEADAIMSIRGEGKSAYAVINGEQIPMANETARDAYRRNASKDYRRQLAELDGELASIDVSIARAREKSGAVKEANESLRAKAHVQAALLNYLA